MCSKRSYQERETTRLTPHAFSSGGANLGRQLGAGLEGFEPWNLQLEADFVPLPDFVEQLRARERVALQPVGAEGQPEFPPLALHLQRRQGHVGAAAIEERG